MTLRALLEQDLFLVSQTGPRYRTDITTGIGLTYRPVRWHRKVKSSVCAIL